MFVLDIGEHSGGWALQYILTQITVFDQVSQTLLHQFFGHNHVGIGPDNIRNVKHEVIEQSTHHRLKTTRTNVFYFRIDGKCQFGQP